MATQKDLAHVAGILKFLSFICFFPSRVTPARKLKDGGTLRLTLYKILLSNSCLHFIFALITFQSSFGLNWSGWSLISKTLHVFSVVVNAAVVAHPFIFLRAGEHNQLLSNITVDGIPAGKQLIIPSFEAQSRCFFYV